MRWLDFGARNRHRRWSERGRNRLSDKGCHTFYEFPYDFDRYAIFLNLQNSYVTAGTLLILHI